MQRRDVIASSIRRLMIIGLVLLPVSSWTSQPESTRNVLLIVVDTLRADRLSTYGYHKETTPHIDALARDGAVFLNHYTQASHTRSAMPSLFYSRYFVRALYPDSSQVPLESASEAFQRVDAAAVALPVALARGGMTSVLFSSHRWLEADSEFGALFDEAYDVRSRVASRPAPGAEQMVDRTIAWLEANRRGRFFLNLHLMDVHEPRSYDEDAEAMYRAEPLGATASEPGDIERLNAEYDGAVHGVDRQLGRLFDYLESRGLMGETLIVLTSDHGENLGRPGRPVGHGGPLYESVARVPLILHQPPVVSPGRLESLSSAVDVMPTILSLAGISQEDGGRWMDGVDLMDVAAVEERRVVVSRHMVRSEDHKLLVELPHADLADSSLRPTAVELYDLRSDPQESENLVARQPALAQALLSEYVEGLARPYQRFVRSRADAPPTSSFALDVRSFEFGPGQLEGQLDGQLEGELEGELEVAGSGAQVEPWSLESAGWSTDPTARTPMLRASQDAGPIEISFPLPSGLFRLSMVGRGRLDVVRVAEKCGQGWPESSFVFDAAGRKSLGRLRTCGARLRLKLVPDGPVELQLFGFEPLSSSGSTLTAKNPQRDRDLQALGYIN